MYPIFRMFLTSATFANHLFFIFAGKPSRVIHIRNIPNESSEGEVINLGISFGRVTNVLVLKGKNQAFLEMADEIAATAMVTYFNANPPNIRGRTVYVQFSNHRELKIDQNHSTTVSISFIVSFQGLFNQFCSCFSRIGFNTITSIRFTTTFGRTNDTRYPWHSRWSKYSTKSYC